MAGGESDGSGLVLLDVFGSPFAQRVRIALAEKGLAYERAEQDLAAKGDLLRRSNPVHGKVPVLLHAGRPVCESLAVLQYLDEAFPGTPPLLPADPYARARARFWAEYADRLHLCGKRLWLRRDEEAAEPEAREGMGAVLRALEAELGGKELFSGEAFGYVDVATAPFAAWFLTYERHGGLSVGVAEECPGLAAWAARCLRRESVAANVYPPEKVYELVQEYRQWVLGRK
ncbi:probable glutathione S-transferase GSTU1 [Panicum virgatum]|uniref:Glutathione S-transferase n=1 Tax=Panicum virgatum TaxID=38727 RepID=A0A8T0MHJ6_PANVG|nr:probable glutathione S-transferase GSTU1 [Panicum virgatum]KAG2534719.1 hypothetical protein PVAP13_9NG079700 [Panicum virgatum]